MSSQPTVRHAAIATIAIATVVANLLLVVAWPLALVAGGAVFLFGELWPRLLIRPQPAALRPTSASYPLSPKEVEVGILVSKGMTSKAIAGRMYRSERTVDNHVTHIYNKLNINSRAELALWFREHGLLSDESNPK